jgi:hypothetical protein
VVCLVIVALAVTVAASSSPQGQWTRITSGGQSGISNIGVARSADGTLHVIWQRKSGSTYDMLHTSISAAGKVGATTPIVTGWNAVDDADLAIGGHGELLAFFAASHSTNTYDPLFGLNLATSTDGGSSWVLTPASIYTKNYAYGRTPSVAVLNGTPIETWYDISAPVVHVGLDPSTAVGAYSPSGQNENIAADPGSGQVMIASCNSVDQPQGLWVAPVNPASGAPAGSSQRMPGATSVSAGKEVFSCPAASRSALVARVGGGFYAAALAGYPSQKRLLVWHVGSPKGAVVAQTSSAFSIQAVALAAAPDGRLWVGWSDPYTGGVARLYLRRSNRAGTVWGQVVTVKGATPTFLNLDLDAQGGRVDAIARYQSSEGAVDLFHTQVFPGLTLRASGGKIISFRVTDAGDPVAGATIAIAGKTLRTDARGNASVDLGRGTFKGVASKAGYVSVSATVHST